MYKEQILGYLRQLNLPPDGYCLFGGCCLAIRDLRATEDIDLYVTKELYVKFKESGWQETNEPGRLLRVTTEVEGVRVDAFIDSIGEGWQPKIQQYLDNPEIIEDYKFMPLSELYEWKTHVRRPKDIRDIKLIDEFWAKQQGN
jgi:hypothetical protein